ncbi:MAG TPA: hypothetical protein DD670_02475 [Planctomycetaceae bacterium]|nr:hypothetical protein [Planctomycetaceae bacterium]
MFWCVCLLALAAFVCATASSARAARSDEMFKAATRLTQDYAASLEQLAAWCDEKGLSAQAAATRERAKPEDPNEIRVPVLPVRVGERAALREGASKDEAEWHERFWRLRRQVAEERFRLAKKAVKAGHASLALDLALAAIHEDPDNDSVRRLMGYQQFRGGWHTPFEVDRLRTGHVWNDRFGWIRKNHLERYEKGERLCDGRWLSADEDSRLRRNINQGWLVTTEHYVIRTNHSLEAGVRLGTQLESLYRVWKQLFLCYYATEEQVIAMFERRATRWKLPRHRVIYFRTRDEYNEMLRPVMPGVEMSIGAYLGDSREAYFFADDGRDERTLLHEATHQLFHESRPVHRRAGVSANCWVIEGLALFMESLRKEGDYYVLGGSDDVRMVAARHRLMVDGFYVPFARMTRYGFPQLHGDPKIPTLYSQMTGLAHFMVYYDNGRYRDALVAYAKAVYDGSQDPMLLSRLTRTSYAELDKQYHEFMKKRSP